MPGYFARQCLIPSLDSPLPGTRAATSLGGGVRRNANLTALLPFPSSGNSRALLGSSSRNLHRFCVHTFLAEDKVRAKKDKRNSRATPKVRRTRKASVPQSPKGLDWKLSIKPTQIWPGNQTARRPNLVAGFHNARHKDYVSDSLGNRKDTNETIDGSYRKKLLLKMCGADCSRQQDSKTSIASFHE
jgi:hypothetical protein